MVAGWLVREKILTPMGGAAGDKVQPFVKGCLALTIDKRGPLLV
jgi:hypothetical protein